jgi:enterochelin esterase-like enzyme
MQFRLQALGVMGFLLLCATNVLAAEGVLSDMQRISSSFLAYDLQYRVYTPAGVAADQPLPSLYVTDGEAYLRGGNFKQVLDAAIGSGEINPVLVIFLDSRNPDNLQEDRRHSQFMCNTEFAKFFAGELVPAISRNYPVSQSREDRVILGLSFGGLNSACFGLMLSELFSGIAMQSPASGEHVEVVRELYEEREKLPLKMYLSVGTINDNLNDVKRFRRTLKAKGYDLTYHKVREGHDWYNWGPLLDEILLTFFARAK